MAKTASPPRWLEPQIPTLVEKPPRGLNWRHEVKWDGYRISIVIDAGAAKAYSVSARAARPARSRRSAVFGSTDFAPLASRSRGARPLTRCWSRAGSVGDADLGDGIRKKN